MKNSSYHGDIGGIVMLEKWKQRIIKMNFRNGWMKRSDKEFSGRYTIGKANGEEADFYIQRMDGFGNAFYSSDYQCVFCESIF